jgi:hypothetical protein
MCWSIGPGTGGFRSRGLKHCSQLACRPIAVLLSERNGLFRDHLPQNKPDRLRSMDGLELKDSLAVAVLENEVLFSVQDGPFAKCSQVWRWRIGSKGLEAVRNGLPEWLEGKVDTAKLPPALDVLRSLMVEEIYGCRMRVVLMGAHCY